jgi:hypothetical protein
MNDNDIALIELKTPISGISVLSFQNIPTYEKEGRVAVILGWGLMENNILPPLLRQGIIPLLSNSTTNMIFKSHGLDLVLNETEISAGFKQGGVSNCLGDSGGPLIIWNGERWVQIGISSWGMKDSCINPVFPSVFTRTSKYIGWISQEILNPQIPSPHDIYNPENQFKGIQLTETEMRDFCLKSGLTLNCLSLQKVKSGFGGK